VFDMKKTYVASALTAAVVIASASLAVMRSTPVSAQSATADRSANANASAPSKAIPRTADGHPDMTGVWWPGHDLIPAQATAVRREGERQGVGDRSFGSLYKPEAAAKAKTLSDKDDPALHCIPSIIGPAMVGNGLVGEIVQTPKTMVQLIETYHGFRIIPTDGRPHRDDVVPSNHGDAVGHWEGGYAGRRRHELQRPKLAAPSRRCVISFRCAAHGRDLSSDGRRHARDQRHRR
jgi:hypothetical protein